jgi:hypothetical protein
MTWHVHNLSIIRKKKKKKKTSSEARDGLLTHGHRTRNTHQRSVMKRKTLFEAESHPLTNNQTR